MSLRDDYIDGDKVAKRILDAHYRGVAPSIIDSMLIIPKGTAHDTVVDWWAYEKERTHFTHKKSSN